jgi:hypothetical protein
MPDMSSSTVDVAGTWQREIDGVVHKMVVKQIGEEDLVPWVMTEDHDD